MGHHLEVVGVWAHLQLLTHMGVVLQQDMGLAVQLLMDCQLMMHIIAVVRELWV